MNSTEFPTPELVIQRLGDHFLESLVDAVDGARADYTDLKAWHPDWAPSYSSRFIANFAHERIWARLIRAIDGAPGIHVRDEIAIEDEEEGLA